VNDRFGHQAGDRLLQQAATAWIGQLREGDVLARYGGEEFAVARYDCPAAEAVEVVERVRSSTPEGQTCSAGIASLVLGEDAFGLVRRADAALYEANRDRDRTVVRA
jgi:diguanylate cyclase (GGDEF)-like protein